VSDDSGPSGQPPLSEREQGTPQKWKTALKAAKSGVAERVSDIGDRLEAARPQSRTIDTTFRAIEHDVETGGGVLAAAVAFRVFLVLIPYIFAVVCVFDVAGQVTRTAPTQIARDFGVGGLLVQAVGASAKHLTGVARLLALLGSLLAVYLAANTFLKTLRIVHGLVWRVRIHKQAHPSRAVLLLIVLITAALMIAAAIGRLRNVSALGGLAAAILYGAITFAIWLVIEMTLPHAPDAGWTDLLPGAVVFGLGTLALNLLTVYWIAHLITRRSATYGSIGAALALLFWAYVLGRVMIASAVLNSALWFRAHPAPATPPPQAQPAPIVSTGTSGGC
jgi:uncharacterized BrkB/YihY/UPF0761 family membrane protein